MINLQASVNEIIFRVIFRHVLCIFQAQKNKGLSLGKLGHFSVIFFSLGIKF